jgi:hypothetical protein
MEHHPVGRRPEPYRLRQGRNGKGGNRDPAMPLSFARWPQYDPQWQREQEGGPVMRSTGEADWPCLGCGEQVTVPPGRVPTSTIIHTAGQDARWIVVVDGIAIHQCSMRIAHESADLSGAGR